ncbi:hypothetical protein WP50_36760 [Lactiplantibacillus plantarum]|nr:hypothetical protein WP50_36760 [Lactiplantibacillus plantarum]
MYYFVNTSINPKKSGIEHAEMKRLALFNQHHVPAKMVTRFFSLAQTVICYLLLCNLRSVY